MENNIEDIAKASNEFNNFMSWLKENHVEIFEKYQRNFSIPFQPGDAVTVNNNDKISIDIYDQLSSIVGAYYSK